MAWATVLVRYGEIGIKSRVVRARFERRLVDDLEHALAARGVEAAIEREWGRLLLHTPEPAVALDAVRHTFGVVSASAARALPATLPEIEKAAREAAPGLLGKGQRFALRVRRTGAHPFTSVDVARALGHAMQEAAHAATGTKPPVDLVNPEVEVHVEVRDSASYLFTSIVRGPGGLPVGVQGKAVVMLDDPSSVLAAWLTMRRGVKPLLVAPRDASEALEPSLRDLAKWMPRLSVSLAEVPENLGHGARRAFLLGACADLARVKKATAVVVGDQAAGLAAYAALDPLAGVPVHRPLLGYPGERLRALAKQAELHVPPPPPVEPDPEDVSSHPKGSLPRRHEVWEVTP